MYSRYDNMNHKCLNCVLNYTYNDIIAIIYSILSPFHECNKYIEIDCHYFHKKVLQDVHLHTPIGIF